SLHLAADRFDEATQIISAHRAAGGFVLPELYPLALAAAGRRDEATAAAGPPDPIRQDYSYDIAMAARGRLGIALNDSARARQAYAALIPYGNLLVGGVLVTGGPVAQVLGEIAEYFGWPEAAATHYQQAAALAAR